MDFHLLLAVEFLELVSSVELHHCSTSKDSVRFFYFHNFSGLSPKYPQFASTDSVGKE
jgi:hypothetical protein